MDSLAGSDPGAEIKAGYRCMLYQDISAKKLQVLLGLYQEALARFITAPVKAKEIMGGSAKADAHEAALVVVANAMLNLDEVITKN